MKNFTSIGLSYLSQKDLLRWLKQYTETPAKIYDDAIAKQWKTFLAAE